MGLPPVTYGPLYVGPRMNPSASRSPWPTDKGRLCRLRSALAGGAVGHNRRACNLARRPRNLASGPNRVGGGLVLLSCDPFATSAPPVFTSMNVMDLTSPCADCDLDGSREEDRPARETAPNADCLTHLRKLRRASGLAAVEVHQPPPGASRRRRSMRRDACAGEQLRRNVQKRKSNRYRASRDRGIAASGGPRRRQAAAMGRRGGDTADARSA
jgi:hypothetical protein